MATDNTVGGLYMRLGLSLDELETDFIAAERTTRENLNRLNRESNLIRLRAEVEIGNLDETADAMQILTVRENALNQQMAIQRDRIRLADAAMQDLIQRHGEESVVAQRAAAALERERLTLQRLERELREVTNAQNDSNNSQGDLGGLGDLGNFSDMLSNLPVGRLAAVGAAIGTVSKAIDVAVDSTEQLVEKFRELETQSYELNMPFQQTKEFLRQLKLGGGDIGDFEGYIRGITDAYVKGEFDDPEFIALEKYGAKIVDNTGKLKDFKDITEEVYQAWKKADAAGEGIEFLQLTGGEAGVRDAIQFFKRYEEAKEDAAKIFDSGIDPAELHEAERALNLLSEQTSEFKDAAANLITPFATDAAKGFFEIFRDGTQLLVESKKEIQGWGFIVEETISTVLSPIEKLQKKISELGNIKLDLGTEEQNKKLQNLIDESNKTPLDGFKNFLKDNVFDGIIERAEQKQKDYNAAVQETTESQKKLNEEIEKAGGGSTLNQYDTKRITAFRDALEDLRLEMQYRDDDFGLEKAQNDLWLQREMTRKNFLSDDERIVLQELHAQKMIDIEQRQADEIAKIQEESEQRTQDYLKSAADIEYSLTHSAFEKQLYDIEQWKDAQLEKADTAEETAAIIANAAAKEADAFQREMDRIQGKIESAQDRLMRLTSSQKDYDLYKAQKQYQQDIKDGIPAGMAQAIYNATIRDIQDRARNDKGGNYTKSKSGNTSNPYLIEFDKPKQTDWTKLDAGNLAYESLRQKNQELADSCSKVIGAQEFLTQSIDFTAQNLNRAAYSFEYIEGDKIVNAFNDSTQRMIDAQNELADATKQTSEEMSATDYWYNRIDQITDQIVGSMANGHIQRIDGGYAADNGYGADLHNFSTGLQQLGLSNEQVHSYLDQINQSVQQLRETEIQQNPQQQGNSNITVSPNINIDLGGAYVFDDAKKQELTNDITNNVVSSVKEAVQDATSRANYGFGN